ncbi:hypothetical protein [Streptomyces collinus]|uniref:hypothetical protein n=1 Tax=Streptomyces collinus TaxID=42684 RepID=UPI0036A74744
MSPTINRARWSGILAVLCFGGGLLASPPAQAASDIPTAAELLAKCNHGTDKCIFHPAGALKIFPGKTHRVGDLAYNCTEDPQTSSRTWEDTTGESNSLGVAFREEFEVGTTFGPTYKFAFEQSYKHTWSNSHTESQSTFIDVPAGEVGWVTRSPQMQRAKGTYELIFGKRFHGHYYWYVPFEATGPADRPSTKSQRSRPMTPRERKTYC